MLPKRISDNQFDLESLVPSHIQKVLNNRHNINQHTERKEGILYLDLNTNAWGSVGMDEDYHNYPDGKATKLRQEIAEMENLKMEQIFMGNGMDEVVDLLIRSFCAPNKDRIVVFSPAAPNFYHFAALSGIMVDEIPLNTYGQLPIWKTKNELQNNTKIIFISNPNPITGIALRTLDIVDILDTAKGLVVVDESYLDYTKEESLAPYIDAYPNLVVLRSYSRVWGLAGLRLGSAYASPAIIEILHKIKPPFNVNSVAQKMALKAMRVPEQRERMVESVTRERRRIKKALERFSFILEVMDSEANFLLVQINKPEQVVEYLLSEGIQVADMSHLENFENCIRIGIGNPENNDLVLEALRLMPSKMSKTRNFFKSLSKTLRRASTFMGFFKKILGS